MKIKYVVICSLLIFLIGIEFYSCNPGIDKISRIEMFQDALNNNTGDQASTNNLVQHFLDGETTLYSAIQSPTWWDTTVFDESHKPFSITNVQESGDKLIIAHITSESGSALNDSITFTMVKSGADWYIKIINISGYGDIIY